MALEQRIEELLKSEDRPKGNNAENNNRRLQAFFVFCVGFHIVCEFMGNVLRSRAWMDFKVAKAMGLPKLLKF